MGSVCVNGRCGFREKSQRRDCPRCGWLMLDGPLPKAGSIAAPPRHRSFRSFVPMLAGGALLFTGAIGMAAGSWASADPTAAASAHGAPASAAAEAPAAAPAPVVAETPAPAKVASKPAAKKTVAKKTASKKKTAKNKPARKFAKKTGKKTGKKVGKKSVARR